MVLIYICICVSVYCSMYVLYLFICACDFKSEHYQKSYHPCLTFGKLDTLLHQTHSKNCWYYGAMTRQLYVHNIIKQNNILHVAWSPIKSKQKSNKKHRRGGGGGGEGCWGETKFQKGVARSIGGGTLCWLAPPPSNLGKLW